MQTKQKLLLSTALIATAVCAVQLTDSKEVSAATTSGAASTAPKAYTYTYVIENYLTSKNHASFPSTITSSGTVLNKVGSPTVIAGSPAKTTTSVRQVATYTYGERCVNGRLVSFNSGKPVVTPRYYTKTISDNGTTALVQVNETVFTSSYVKTFNCNGLTGREYVNTINLQSREYKQDSRIYRQLYRGYKTVVTYTYN